MGVHFGEAILGKWNLVEKQKNGEPSGSIDSDVAVLDGKTFKVEVGSDKIKIEEVWAYKLDEDKKWIDLSPLAGSDETIRGVYLLDGDTLIIAVGRGAEGARPKEAKSGPEIAFLKLQRIKEEKK